MLVPTFTLISASFSFDDDEPLIDAVVRGLIYAVVGTFVASSTRKPDPYAHAFPRLSDESAQRVIAAYEGRDIELNKTEYEQLQKFVAFKAKQAWTPRGARIISALVASVALIAAIAMAFRSEWFTAGGWVLYAAVALILGERGVRRARADQLAARARIEAAAKVPVAQLVPTL